jgi:hypothetical protein
MRGSGGSLVGSPSEGESALSQADSSAAAEAADLKAAEIVKENPVGEYTNSQYGITIDIQGVSKIPGGVEVFARASKNGKPLGFGPDGTVETERFRFFNPPILVDDPTGSIVREWTDSVTKQTVTRHLREDPIAAIRDDLAHAISLTGKEGAAIVRKKLSERLIRDLTGLMNLLRPAPAGRPGRGDPKRSRPCPCP